MKYDCMKPEWATMSLARSTRANWKTAPNVCGAHEREMED